MASRLILDFSMSKDDIKQAILQNRDFVDFLSPECKDGHIFFSAEEIPFVVFHTIDGNFELYLSTFFIGKLDKQIIGSFVDRVKAAIKEVCAEVYA